MTYQVLHKIRWRPVALMFLLAIPLLPGLRFTAEVFPNWDDSSYLHMIDDRHTLVVRSSSSNERWSTYVNRYFLLDSLTGRLHKIQPADHMSAGLNSGGYPFLRIMRDGRIARSQNPSQWIVYITEPQGRATQTIVMRHGSPILVGDRFLVSQVKPNNEQIYWYDLQAPQLEEHFQQFATYNTELATISGCPEPVFFDLYSHPSQLMAQLEEADSPSTEVEPQPTDSPTQENIDPADVEEEHPPRRPDWDLELKNLPTGTPKPHPSVTQFAMLALYRMTKSGPVEIAHWPTGIDESYAPSFFVQADGPYIFCLSLDAQSIEVHDAASGEIRQRIPFPIGTGTPATTDWRANRIAISVFNGTAWQSYDPKTGQPLPSDPSVGIVLSVQGDRYLTLAPQAPSTPPALAFHAWPMRLQVRHYPAGEILSSYLMPDLQASLSWAQLTDDAKQVIVPTENERILYFDALTGHINKVIQAAPWPYYTCILTMTLLIVWIAFWIRTADRSGLPRLITMLVVTAIVVAFLLMRLQLSGHPQLRLRLATIGVLAIATAWSIELSQHLVRPGCSLLNRSFSLSIYLVCIYLIPFQLVHRYDTIETVLACVLLQMILAAFYFSLRQMGRLPPYPHSPTTQQFSLRSILVVTAFVALAISVGYRLPWRMLHYPGAMATAAILAMSVAVIALMLAVRHAWWMRIIAIPVCLAVAYTIHVDRYAWAPWCWPLSMYVACTTITCSFCVVPSIWSAVAKLPLSRG